VPIVLDKPRHGRSLALPITDTAICKALKVNLARRLGDVDVIIVRAKRTDALRKHALNDKP